MSSNKGTVVGVFTDRTRAQRVVSELKGMGFRDDQIGVISHNQDHVGTSAEGATSTKATEGAAVGAATGAGVGALWALGIAAGVLPAIGPVVAGGLLASVLASAAGGAAVAGIVGALVGLGIPEEEARYYEGEIKAGRTLVTVRAGNRYDEVRSLFLQNGAYDMHGGDASAHCSTTQATAGRASSSGRTHASSPYRTEEAATVKVHAEQLRATKVPVEEGEVRLRKEVVTEHKNVQVPVTREEVVVEHRPASGQASAADIRPGEEVRIPVKQEQGKVQKEAVVTGEVSIGKRRVTETENVAGTVRKEQVKVEKTGDVKVHGE